MKDQAKKIIAFIFKRSGKTELSFSDMYLTLSMELNWFTPDDAKDFVNRAIDSKLLTKKNKQIRPSFDVSEINIPLGFSPDGGLFGKKEDFKKEDVSVLNEIINSIMEEKNLDKKEIYDRIKKIEKEKNLNTYVSALIVGKEFDINFDSLIPKIEKEIFR